MEVDQSGVKCAQQRRWILSLSSALHNFETSVTAAVEVTKWWGYECR